MSGEVLFYDQPGWIPPVVKEEWVRPGTKPWVVAKKVRRDQLYQQLKDPTISTEDWLGLVEQFRQAWSNWQHVLDAEVLVSQGHPSDPHVEMRRLRRRLRLGMEWRNGKLGFPVVIEGVVYVPRRCRPASFFSPRHYPELGILQGQSLIEYQDWRPLRQSEQLLWQRLDEMHSAVESKDVAVELDGRMYVRLTIDYYNRQGGLTDFDGQWAWREVGQFVWPE